MSLTIREAVHARRVRQCRKPMNEHENWEAKHRARRASEVGDPDPFFLRALELVGPGEGRRAWDLASGRGRHALELARRGFEVLAFDRSAEALEQLAQHARAEGLQVMTRLADLEAPDFAAGEPRADLLVVINYLDRALLERLGELVLPGGQLLYATFTKEREGDHPSDRWCLDPGELLVRFSRAEVRTHEEHAGRAGLLARIGVSCRDGGE